MFHFCYFLHINSVCTDMNIARKNKIKEKVNKFLYENIQNEEKLSLTLLLLRRLPCHDNIHENEICIPNGVYIRIKKNRRREE